MKTEKFYNDKINIARMDIEKWNNRINELQNPKPLKPANPKSKTKIISFRVPCDSADMLKKLITDFLNNQ